jgi:hypothetical protein
LVPKAFDAYLNGKLMTVLRDEHLAPQTVRWVEVKFCMKGAIPGRTLPTMNVLRIVHNNGKTEPNDPEA